MNKENIRKLIRKTLPRVRNVDRYVDIMYLLYKKAAVNKKTAVRTAEVDHLVEGNVFHPLKKLEKCKLIKRVRKSAVCFMFDASAAGKNSFLYTREQIRQARINGVKMLVKQVQNDGRLLLICLATIGMEGTEKLETVVEAVKYADDDTERKNLFNYNQIVQKFKQNKIILKGFDELVWRRGSHSWFI